MTCYEHIFLCFAKYDGYLSTFHVSSNIAEYDITVTCVLIMTRVQCKIYILALKKSFDIWFITISLATKKLLEV